MRGTFPRKSSSRSSTATTRETNRVRQPIELAPVAIFIFQDNKNVFVNLAAERITGYSRQELLRMEFWAIIHPDFRPMVNQRGKARQRGLKVPSRYDVKIIRKDGAERWLDYSGAPITWRGKPAVLGTVIDITDKKHAEDELRRRLAQLQALHDAVLAANANLELKTVLDVLLEKIDAFLGISIVSVLRVRDNQTGELQAMTLRNIDEENWLRFVPWGGSGLSRTVLETNVPVTASDATSDPRVRYPEFFRRLGLISYLGLPLTIGDRVIGDIGLYTKEKHEFSQEEITFISTLTNQAAIAIHNSQLYQQSKRRADELAALNDITHAAIRSHELGPLLAESAQAIARIAHFDSVRIYIFDEVAQANRLQATFDKEPGRWSLVTAVSRGVGIIGNVTDSGEPAIFEDIGTDARYLRMSHTGGAQKAGGRFFGVFPIKSKLKSWGAISCMAKAPRVLHIEDKTLIMRMCDHLAVAIENATLLQNSAEKAQELSTLYSVVGDCMRFLDVNALLYQTMRRVLDIFGFEAARIYLRDENREEFSLVVHEGFDPSIKLPEHCKLGHESIGFVAQSGECLAISDSQNDAEYLQRAGSEVDWGRQYRGVIFMPLKTREGTIGVMNFFSKSTRPFAPAELEQIRAIAYHLGTAIGNARLFWQLTRRTRELTKANQAKDEFLGVISHELRTPLNVILGYTDIMKQNMAGDLTPQALAMVSKVQGQAQALSTLVESILVTTQIEAGTIKAVVSEVNLAEFFLQLGSLFEPPREKNVRLIWNLPAELPTIWTDRTKLQRVLRNLIDNALKFTEEGRITVSVHFLEDDGKISFVVEDTGVGIPQRDAAQVFDMFRQGDSSTTRSHDGVGLGLYIVKKFTELLHGTVELTSQPGEGSIVTVKIPRNPQSLTK